MFNPAALQSDQLMVNYSIQAVYQAIMKASKNGRLRVQDANEKLYRVILKIGASAFSWGEIVTLQLSSFENNTVISISSQQKTWVGSGNIMSQLSIGRKNKQNIDNVLNIISDYL